MVCIFEINAFTTKYKKTTKYYIFILWFYFVIKIVFYDL